MSTETERQKYGRCELWKQNPAKTNHLNQHPQYESCVNWRAEQSESPRSAPLECGAPVMPPQNICGNCGNPLADHLQGRMRICPRWDRTGAMRGNGFSVWQGESPRSVEPDQCVVCGADLLPREMPPPHCEDCQLEEEHWHEADKSLNSVVQGASPTPEPTQEKS